MYIRTDNRHDQAQRLRNVSPRTKHAGLYRYTQVELKNACRDSNMNVREAARIFGVPKNTMSNASMLDGSTELL